MDDMALYRSAYRRFFLFPIHSSIDIKTEKNIIMITSLYTTHLIITGITALLMIVFYSRSVMPLEKAVRSTLVLVYSLVLLGAALFALRYYISEGTENTVLLVSQVISYFLFFGALWHILMATVASGIKNINNVQNQQSPKEYDPEGKSIINI